MSTGTPDLQPETAEHLVERAGAGDQAAWDTLVRLYRRKVFNVAYRFVGTHDGAEDLTQDIFLKVFRSLRTFDRRANFQTWLISVSRNLCIDDYRTRRREHETIDRGVDASLLTPASSGSSPDAGLEGQDRVALLRAGLQALSPTLRSAVLLRDLHELSYQEVADRLGVAPGTVKSRINRGRAELARQLRRIRQRQQGDGAADAGAARSRRSSTRRPTGVSK
jgi:RNA polymerase sigma-70 factor (ECF subfamily)